MNLEIDKLDRNQKANAEEVETYRLSISKIAAEALGEIVECVNDSFKGGKVSRSQIANWALIKFRDGLTPDGIKDIRVAHIDEFAALDAVLRQAKETGKLPVELKTYLQRHIGAEGTLKGKSKKRLQENNINDVMKNIET